MSSSGGENRKKKRSSIQVNMQRIIAMHGGHDAWIKAVEKSIADFDLVWEQDTGRIGRVLRAHLAVEHFVGKYLALKNPDLVSIERARLSYAQKLDLLNPTDPLVELLIPGLRLFGNNSESSVTSAACRT
jgi:hypothetical protein